MKRQRQKYSCIILYKEISKNVEILAMTIFCNNLRSRLMICYWEVSGISQCS